MTIEIEVEPELERKVLLEAESRGISVAAYVREVLVEKTELATQDGLLQDAEIAKAHANLLERMEEKRKQPRPSFEEFLDAMAYHGPIPEEMKTQKITREFIYGNHP